MNSEKIYLFFFTMSFIQGSEKYLDKHIVLYRKSYLILTHCGLQLKSAIVSSREYDTFEVFNFFQHKTNKIYIFTSVIL